MQSRFHLFADITAHGFGHLAIAAPVLNALAESAPGFRLTVRSALPRAKLCERIDARFEVVEGSTDFGYVMVDATHVDLAASAATYRAAHADWPARVAAEADFLRELAPDAVLSNISYLPLAGAAQAGIPALGLCSLNWADLFLHFFGNEAWAAAIHAEMLDAYRSAEAFLRVTPGMAMTALGNVESVAPIAAVGRRHDLGLGRDKVVLVGMGGIAHHLPVDDWPRLPGIRWIVPSAWQCRHPDAIATESLGHGFTDLLCSVDAVIAKPGYGTFAEAACNGTPVLYLRREDWPEQDCLIAWLEENGRCGEIGEADLRRGRLGAALERLWQLPAAILPVADGARQAAARIRSAGNRSA